MKLLDVFRYFAENEITKNNLITDLRYNLWTRKAIQVVYFIDFQRVRFIEAE